MKKTNGTILIVDDNSVNAELLVETLEPLNYEILSYTNPRKALSDLKNTKIDVVLIDIVMPEIDGFTFAKKFLKNHQNTPVIFVSAYTQCENKIKGYNMGSFAYIEKPFDVNTARAQVQSVLKLKKVQDELLKEKEKLDCIFEFSSNEIILTDLDFNIVSRNCKIIEKSESLSENFCEILKHNNQVEALDSILMFKESDEKNTSFRVIFDKKKYTKTNISKIYNGLDVTGFLVVIDDRTEEIKIGQQRDNFIETLTHDLKTPVRAEKMALELLYQGRFGELNDEQKNIIKEVLNSSGCIMRMTDNILTKYKFENNRYKMNKKPNSINRTLESSLKDLKYLLESQNQTICIESESVNDVFDFDEKAIEKVLKNIIANASEYSPTGSVINIEIKKIGKSMELSVKDKGSGISEEKLKDIFEEPADTNSGFKKVGSGLGLFITKRITEAHNGTISAESVQGEGSCFKLVLPIEHSCGCNLIRS